MSAFMVSDKHIDALVIFAVRHNVSFRVNGNRVNVTKTNAEEIGQQLVDENFRSVNARYAERTEGYFGKAPTYKIEITKALSKPDLEPVVVIKQCHCYAYQACENDNWEQSAAFEIVNAIEAAAVRKLPGYDAAPWGID
jgi:hypothetical protein